MLYVVYILSPHQEKVMIGAFLMKTDAEKFAESSYYLNPLIMETSPEAWDGWCKIRQELPE